MMIRLDALVHYRLPFGQKNTLGRGWGREEKTRRSFLGRGGVSLLQGLWSTPRDTHPTGFDEIKYWTEVLSSAIKTR